MPYISQEDRENPIPDTLKPGTLTYLLYQTILNALPTCAKYSDFCTVLGALETTKLEFYRRFVAPYEDMKIEGNGEVS